MDIQLTPVDEPMRVYDSPPSETQMIREIDIPKRHKASRLGGLQLSFCGKIGNVLTSKLTKQICKGSCDR